MSSHVEAKPARAFHSLVQFDGCLHSFGGISSVNPFVELPPIYSTQTQTDCPAIRNGKFPIAERYLSSIFAVDNQRIYFLGGLGNDFTQPPGNDGYLSFSGASSTISWFSLTNLRLFGHAACAISPSDVFVYGGATFDGAISSAFLEWRQKSTKWTKIVSWYGPLPPPLIGHTLSCSKDTMKIYLFGGFTLNSLGKIIDNKKVYVFDLIIKEWSLMMQSEARYFHSVSFLQGKYNSSTILTGHQAVLAVIGGKLSTSNVELIDTRCQTNIPTLYYDIPRKILGPGVSSATIPTTTTPYFKLMTSGGFINWGSDIDSGIPSNINIQLPTVSSSCPSKSSSLNNGKTFWRCAVAINAVPMFNGNASFYHYDVYLPNRGDSSTFVDVDALANILSVMTSAGNEWTVQCKGWLRLDSMLGVNLANSFGTTADDRRNLYFRFGVYLYVDGTLAQSYIPPGQKSGPSLPLFNPNDELQRGNNGNGIFLVSIFLNGYGPIIPSGTNIHLQSSDSGAMYLLPTSLISNAVAEMQCSSPGAQANCLTCLLNSACSWVPTKPKGACVARRLEIPTADKENNLIDVIRDAASCPSCFSHSANCKTCIHSSTTCTWVPGTDLCLPEESTLNIPEATKTCAPSCFERTTCSSCLDETDSANQKCLWCPVKQQCLDLWMAESGIPAALGCQAGCLPDLLTTTSIPKPTIVCNEDKR